MKIFDVKWNTTTAGPSPYNNERTEIFLFGCNKAKSGKPCKGCFNSKAWDDDPCVYFYTPEQVFEKIEEFAPNRYITIGGGEPTDQIDELIELCKLLKKDNYHVLVYTYHTLLSHIAMESEFSKKFIELLNYIDILIDGEYCAEERLYNDNINDGFLNSVGSGNQIIWSIKQDNGEICLDGCEMRNLHSICLDDNNGLIFCSSKGHIKMEIVE